MPRLYPVVEALTLKGKTLLYLLRGIFRTVEKISGRSYAHPRPDFEENPLFFNQADLLYFGHKYYYAPPEKAEADSGIEAYFAGQDLRPVMPPDFEEKTSITLSAGGDLMPYEWINSRSARHLWDETGDFFFGSDLVFANLETPIDARKKASAVPEVMLNDMLFNGSEELFNIFSGNGNYRGYDVLSTANNHSMDMGEAGVAATIGFLHDKGIAHTGTALTDEARFDFPILERKGIRTAFIAATYSLNKFEVPGDQPWLVNHARYNVPGCDISLIRKLVEKARERGADIVVLSLHTGCAYQAYPSRHTVEVYHRIFTECGPDIILGGHPHNPQPMERFSFNCPFSGIQKNGFAIYSLGDFVAYDIFTWCHLPILLKLQISKGMSAGKECTLLRDIMVMPVFNCGKITREGFEMRFLDLNKLAQQDFSHPFLDEKKAAEARELYRLFTRYFLPADNRVNLA